MPGVAAVPGEGMKVPVRLIPKITVHTAAHDNRSNDPAPRGAVDQGRVVTGGQVLQIHQDGHRGHPAGWVLAAAALNMSVRGISAALGRGGGVVGVRGSGERCQGFGQDRPVDLVEHPVIAHIPFARADRRRDRLARCWSSVRSRWVGLSASAATCSTRRTSEASVNFARPTIAASLLVKSSMAGAWARI